MLAAGFLSLRKCKIRRKHGLYRFVSNLLFVLFGLMVVDLGREKVNNWSTQMLPFWSA